jgi:hypothetical protein
VLQSQINWVWPLAIWQDLEKCALSYSIAVAFSLGAWFVSLGKQRNEQRSFFMCQKYRFKIP